MQNKLSSAQIGTIIGAALVIFAIGSIVLNYILAVYFGRPFLSLNSDFGPEPVFFYGFVVLPISLLSGTVIFLISLAFYLDRRWRKKV